MAPASLSATGRAAKYSESSAVEAFQCQKSQGVDGQWEHGWGWLGWQVADSLNVSNLTNGIGVKVLELR